MFLLRGKTQNTEVKIAWARSKSSKPSQKRSLQSHRNIQRAVFADFVPAGHAWILDTAPEKPSKFLT